MMGEQSGGTSSAARAAGVMTALLLLAAACGGDGGSTTEGLANSEVDVTTTAVAAPETASTSAPAATTTGEADSDEEAANEDGAHPSDFHELEPSAAVPERLSPGLTYAEIKNLLIDLHGPTDDIGAEMNRLTIFPSDIPTPADANLYDFNAGVQLDERYRQNIDSEVRFTVPAEQDEVVALYESALPTAGYVLVSTSEEQRDGALFKSLEFDTATTPVDLQNGVDIETISGDFEGTFVTIAVKGNPPEGSEAELREAIAALEPYFGNTPVPDGGTQQRVWVQSFVNTSLFGFHWLSVTGTWSYPLESGPEVAQGVLDLTAGSDYQPLIRDGDPDHAETLAAAEEEDAGFALINFIREGEFNGPRITLRDFYGTGRTKMELEFYSGSTDLFGNYSSYGQ